MKKLLLFIITVSIALSCSNNQKEEIHPPDGWMKDNLRVTIKSTCDYDRFLQELNTLWSEYEEYCNEIVTHEEKRSVYGIYKYIHDIQTYDRFVYDDRMGILIRKFKESDYLYMKKLKEWNLILPDKLIDGMYNYTLVSITPERQLVREHPSVNGFKKWLKNKSK